MALPVTGCWLVDVDQHFERTVVYSPRLGVTRSLGLRNNATTGRPDGVLTSWRQLAWFSFN